MVRLSIVIPAVGDQPALDDTLLSVLEDRPPETEVILVHSPDYHDPYDLADEVRFVCSVPGRSLVGLLNDGSAAAKADLIHWLQPGVRATPGWTDRIESLFQTHHAGLVLPLVFDERRTNRLLAVGVTYRRAGRRQRWARGRRQEWLERRTLPSTIAPTLAAGFLDRRAVGAPIWDESLGEWADLDLAIRVASQPLSIELDRACVLIGSPALFEPRRGYRAGWQAEAFFWRHRSRGTLPLHLLATAAGLLGRIHRPESWCEIAGRIAGFIAATRSRTARPPRIANPATDAGTSVRRRIDGPEQPARPTISASFASRRCGEKTP